MKIRGKFTAATTPPLKGSREPGPSGSSAASREGPAARPSREGPPGARRTEARRRGAEAGAWAKGVVHLARSSAPACSATPPRRGPDAGSRPAPDRLSFLAESWRTLLTNCSRADAMFSGSRDGGGARETRAGDPPRKQQGGDVLPPLKRREIYLPGPGYCFHGTGPADARAGKQVFFLPFSFCAHVKSLPI